MAKGKGSRIGVWIILGLLFVGLIGFGTTNLSGNIRSIGSAGDKDIGVQTYANALTQQIDAFSAQLGQPLSFPQAQAFGIDRAVLSQVVSTAVLDNEVAQLGVSVGDERVAERVVQIPAFQGISGSFDREAYRFTLDRNGLTEREFESGLRDDMARTLLQSAVLGGIPEAEVYADTMLNFVGERRSFDWAPLTADILTDPLPAPTEEDMLAQYEATPEAYTAPEIRKITYAAILPEMIQDEVEVDDTAVRELYDARINDYVQPERRLVERLVFGNEAQANDAMASLTAGETDFDTLVSDRGLDLADVDLGDVAADDLGAASEAVFGAAPGDVVGPVMTSLGPALFRMNAILGAEEISFEEAAPDLRAELGRDRARRVIAGEYDRIIDLIAGGAAIEDLAEQTRLELGTIDWSEEVSDGIAAYDLFRQQAMATEVGAFPELSELDDGGLFTLRVDEIVAPALRPLDEVREQVIADRVDRATAEAVGAVGAELQAQVGNGAAMSDLGLSVTSEANAIRRNFIPDTPQGLMAEVFDMALGEARVISDETGLTVLVHLTDIAPVDMDDPTMAAEAEAIAARTSQGIAQDIYSIFTASVQARTDVSINQAAITAVHANYQ
ncbi:peptidylprolyl isomerase [Flavimaricola marinus]|uniref:Peptidyl-prolyl cis-trans isomerase D n=1 Tax=Flavimaricola marinus TaxID=1819565 RepID=A0A238LGF0_9RHOB|nr:peptidylprolyl isomerase [Flavimaricola marinus]SMY07970.1 Peptidyl-prolyl cis-trans isomerase D [Flavimaricola marinus]